MHYPKGETQLPAEFLAQPEVRWVNGGNVELIKPLRFRDAAGVVWTVPSGFCSDLASVPRWLPGIVRMTFPDRLRTASAAILHDYLCRFGWPRKSADRLFWEALRAQEVSRFGAFMMWSGVRIGAFIGIGVYK